MARPRPSKSLEHAYTLWAALTLGQGVWGFLPSAVGGAVTATVFRLGEFSPVWSWLGFLGAYLAIMTVWSLTKSSRLSVATSVLLALAGSYTIYVAYEHYSVEYVEFSAGRAAQWSPAGPVVTRAVVVLNLKNPNGFPIYTQLIQHQSSLEGHDTGQYTNEPEPIRKHGANSAFKVIDDPIQNLSLRPIGAWFHGRVDFIIRYGRTHDRLNKTLHVHGPLAVLFCNDDAHVCGVEFTQDSYELGGADAP